MLVFSFTHLIVIVINSNSCLVIKPSSNAKYSRVTSLPVYLFVTIIVDIVRIELTLTIMSGCHDIVSYYTSSLSLSITGILLDEVYDLYLVKQFIEFSLSFIIS